jgi:hypothetical protein
MRTRIDGWVEPVPLGIGWCQATARRYFKRSALAALLVLFSAGCEIASSGSLSQPDNSTDRLASGHLRACAEQLQPRPTLAPPRARPEIAPPRQGDPSRSENVTYQQEKP